MVTQDSALQFDALVNALDGFTEDIESAVEVSLRDIERDLPSKLKNAGYTHRTNKLRDSIFARTSGNRLTFGMKAYGFYQIFGVVGKQRRSASTLGVLGATFNKTGSGKFSYSSNNNHPGLKGYESTAEYLKDITQLLTDQIIENIDFTK